MLERIFTRAAEAVARLSGRPPATILAIAAVLVWAAAGPLFGFSAAWQLVINTGTTIITFLMVFLIQATQNRDTAAIRAQLDELIKATPGARDELTHLEEKTEAEIEEVRP